MVLSCIDPRFQPIVYNYLKKEKLNGRYSSFTIAGAAIGVTFSKFKKWHKAFWDNIDTSIKLHKIKKLIVINHRDCGAAKWGCFALVLAALAAIILGLLGFWFG